LGLRLQTAGCQAKRAEARYEPRWANLLQQVSGIRLRFATAVVGGTGCWT